MTKLSPTILRTGATVLISIAVAMQTLYPTYTWIAVIVAAASAVGIHAIPAVSQAATAAIPVITTEVAKVADNDNDPKNAIGVNGMALMGLTPPVVAQKVAEPEPVAAPTPVAAPEPVATPVEPVAVTPPVATVETAQKTAEPVAAAPEPTNDNAELVTLLKVAADGLNAVAAKLA